MSDLTLFLVCSVATGTVALLLLPFFLHPIDRWSSIQIPIWARPIFLVLSAGGLVSLLTLRLSAGGRVLLTVGLLLLPSLAWCLGRVADLKKEKTRLTEEADYHRAQLRELMPRLRHSAKP